MLNIFKKIEHYGQRSKDIFEHALLSDNRPLDKEGPVRFNEFLKLSKGQKLLEILYLVKDLLPEEFFKKYDFKKFFYNDRELPFNPNKFSFEGLEGHGVTAMFICWKVWSQISLLGFLRF